MVVEMHTGGEPVRIAVSGYPEIVGDAILDKRRYCKENLDQLRKVLMEEPRGHKDMYGIIPVNSDIKEADMAVLFIDCKGDQVTKIVQCVSHHLRNYLGLKFIVSRHCPQTGSRINLRPIACFSSENSKFILGAGGSLPLSIIPTTATI